jgi:hypothetical protein
MSLNANIDFSGPLKRGIGPITLWGNTGQKSPKVRQKSNSSTTIKLLGELTLLK